MDMVIGRFGLKCALILPTVVLHVTIRKRNRAPPFVNAAWKIEKRFLVHVSSEVRPANALLVHILNEKNVRRRLELAGFLKKLPVIKREAAIAGAFPAEIIVERITANPGITLTQVAYGGRIAGTNIVIELSNVLGEKGPVWVQ